MLFSLRPFRYLLLGAILIITTAVVPYSEKNTSYSVKIRVTNIRNKKGHMQFQVFRSQDAFASESAYRTYRVSKKNVSNKTLTYTIHHLPKGTYGIALLDDENDSKEMDYSWMMPTEGFGFSDYYHTAWSKPTFHKFKFYLQKDHSVTMKVRYM